VDLMYFMYLNNKHSQKKLQSKNINFFDGFAGQRLQKKSNLKAWNGGVKRGHNIHIYNAP